MFIGYQLKCGNKRVEYLLSCFGLLLKNIFPVSLCVGILSVNGKSAFMEFHFAKEDSFLQGKFCQLACTYI
jgi:hypothetical protein